MPTTTRPTATYREIPARLVPDGIRWDIPGRNAGQIVEIAYGTFGRSAAADGERYRRVHDRSIGPDAIRYYQRVCDECQRAHDAWTPCADAAKALR